MKTRFANQVMFAALLALVVAGCGNPNAKEMQGTGPTEPWPELNEFQSGPIMSIGYPAEMDAWGEVKKAAASEEFKAAVAKLEQSSPPSGYNKDVLVQALKDLIAAAETGTEEDVKAKYEAYRQAVSQATAG